ncbi:MAG: ketoacyl-ACP synthase III [Verrucomicrobiaceae bacterium]|nr:ketoacyl-ACP synthase III [Verrucomicrobiaceae bacterium]
MNVFIKAIEYHLPERVLGNEELSREFPEWTPERIEAKIGITERHIAAEGETAADLGVKAAQKLFASGACTPADIDFLLFCTQSPDYCLPTSACVMQHRLGLPTTAGALDFNLGCSGYVYGLSLAKGLIETGQAKRVLLITADTYSKFMHVQDKSVRTLFGDAAAATLLEAGEQESVGPFVFGTDGAGAHHLIVEAGAARKPQSSDEVSWDEHGNPKSESCLFMNGPEIFAFTQDMVPKSIDTLLAKVEMKHDDIDLFVFHQANQYMLEFLRRKIGIPKEKFVVSMRTTGNTVSATIPIALREAQKEGKLHAGMKIMLVGFGVGYSWAATLLRWQA